MKRSMKRLMKGVVGAVAMTGLLSGCTSFRAVEKNTTVSPGETLFVLGVSPENYRVKVFPGTVKDGVFREDTLGLAAVYGGPDNGYVVGKAHKGDVLAITMVRRLKDTADVLGQDFVPCAGYKTMVFTVPDQPVVYLGDVSYTTAQNGRGLAIRYTDNLEAVTAYLAKNYPNLPSAPVPAAYDLRPAKLSCTTTVVVPIYVR